MFRRSVAKRRIIACLGRTRRVVTTWLKRAAAIEKSNPFREQAGRVQPVAIASRSFATGRVRSCRLDRSAARQQVWPRVLREDFAPRRDVVMRAARAPKMCSLRHSTRRRRATRASRPVDHAPSTIFEKSVQIRGFSAVIGPRARSLMCWKVWSIGSGRVPARSRCAIIDDEDLIRGEWMAEL